MKKIVVIERKDKIKDTFVINIEDIKHIKNNIELSLDVLIEKINTAIKEDSFEEGLEYIKLANKIDKKNPKINSLEFILKGNMLISQYNKDHYNLLFLADGLDSLIKSILYLDEIENSEAYKETFFKVKDLRDKIVNENIIDKLENTFEEVKNENVEEVKNFIKGIFKNKYENNFYNSIEFNNNIIENNIYINTKAFNKFSELIEETYLLYKFNLEEDIREKIDILVKLKINEIFIVEYAYVDYLVNSIKEDKYKTIEDLKNNISKVFNEISTFNKKYMPI